MNHTAMFVMLIFLQIVVLVAIIRMGRDDQKRLEHEILSHLSRRGYTGRALCKLIRLNSSVRFYAFMEVLNNRSYVAPHDSFEEIDGVRLRIRSFSITDDGRKKLEELDAEIDA